MVGSIVRLHHHVHRGAILILAAHVDIDKRSVASSVEGELPGVSVRRLHLVSQTPERCPAGIEKLPFLYFAWVACHSDLFGTRGKLNPGAAGCQYCEPKSDCQKKPCHMFRIPIRWRSDNVFIPRSACAIQSD